MATTPSAPTGASATDASDQMPDCIIASSNRYDDLLPFCNSLYHAHPQKWGCILPWEFPQRATKQVEDDFLRKYFTETEIHMQGGAHGVGAGFRFLKQAWYSVAMWNHEKRIPAIATWWLESKENSSLLRDPAMRYALCNDGAAPETFFESRDVQMYGRNLLSYVVKHIQEQVKSKQAPPIEEAQTTDKLRSASDSNMALDLAETKPTPVASALEELIDRSTRESSYNRKQPRAATVPTDEFVTPFPGYEEKPYSKQHIRHSDHAPSVWSAGYPNHQVQGRKRGGRLSSAGSGTRGGFDRPVQAHQQRFNPSMFPSNGVLVNDPAAFGAHVSGPAMHPSHAMATYPNIVPHMPGVPPVPTYEMPGTRTPVQHTRGPTFPSGEHQVQYAVTPSMFPGESTNRGPFAQRNEMERLSSDWSANSGFNNIPTRSGDVRRSSFSSRGGGGGLRGSDAFRGSKRGGRGRDYGHQASSIFEEGSYARKAVQETYHKPNSNYGKRRGSAYQENTWRSGSEHPQVENTLPQRVLSGPSEYPAYTGFPASTGSHLLPAFTFPHNQAGEMYTPTERHPLPARPAGRQQVLLDLEVDERYIGKDATHVKELVVFNVPSQLTEDEVARDFSRTCDVKVVTVHFDNRGTQSPDHVVKLAFIEFPNHNVARRVLDLREVSLYDKPLAAVVPRKYHDQAPMPFIPGQHGQGLSAAGGSFVPSGQFSESSYGYPHESVPPPQFGLAATANNSHGRPGGMPHPAFVNFPPPMPFNAGNGETALPTVFSSNATPANSEPNTPRKKKKNKKKVTTPHARIIENESGAPMSSINEVPFQETPSKIKHRKQEPQDRAASNDLVPAVEATSTNAPSVTKDLKPLTNAGSEAAKTLQEPSDRSDENLQVAADIKRSSEAPQIDDRQSDTTPTVSPRSQIPKDPSNEADLVFNGKQSQLDGEPGVLRLSSPVSDKDRPGIVSRISDSDHVDESFHTASASPPTDKQSQIQAASTADETPPYTARTKAATVLTDKRSTSSQIKKVDIGADVQVMQADDATRHDSTIAPRVSPQKVDLERPQHTPATPLPISVEAPTHPKKQSTNALSGDKLPGSASQRSVSDPLRGQQTTFSTKVSTLQEKNTPRAEDLSVEIKVPLAKAKEAHENRAQTLTAQQVVSATSIPPTPMTAYHTAPTTPASIDTSTSKDSAEKSSGQAKTPAKRGPSQTESFSMFGKKQQKQKKPAKGKGTLKGKPLEPAKGSNPASGTSNQEKSGTATPLPTTSTSTKKPTLTVKTETNNDAQTSRARDSTVGSRSGENVFSGETPTAASGQSSPSKSSIRNLFGLFGRVKSPSASVKETSLEDVPPEDELMGSRAVAAIPQAVFNIDHLLQQRSFDDERMKGDSSVFTTQINTDFDDAAYRDTSGMSATGLGISASSSADIKETPKKKRKKRKGKSAKLSLSQRESDPEADRDADGTSSIATPSARTDATSGSFDDNDSEKSSTTMGRPTPPVSPVTLTPSKRRLIEQRRTEEHIVSPRAPRNKHVKKKSYSRIASYATASSAQETPQPSAGAISETEADQQKRLLSLYQRTGSDDDGDSNGIVTLPDDFTFSDLVNEGGSLQVIFFPKRVILIQNSNDGRRVNIFRRVRNGSDDDSDDAARNGGKEMSEYENSTEGKVIEDD